MELALRKVAISDLPLLGEIRRAAIMAQPETFWTHEEKLKAANAWSTMDLSKDFASYHAFITNDNDASVAWKENYLGYIFILPAAQKNHLGSRLLKFAEDEISKKYDHIWLTSHPYSEKFYIKHGFIKTSETENVFGTTLLHKFQKTFE